MTWPTQTGVHDLGDLALSAGGVLRDAKLSWKAHGTLAPGRRLCRLWLLGQQGRLWFGCLARDHRRLHAGRGRRGWRVRGSRTVRLACEPT